MIIHRKLCFGAALLLLLAGAALLPPPALAVGVATPTCAQVGNSPVWKVSWAWTADASAGTVPATAAPCATVYQLQGDTIVQVETKPGSPAPTGNYSVTITDDRGGDVTAGALAALSASAAQMFAVTAPPLDGGLTLNLSGNSVNSAKGTVTVYLAPGNYARRGAAGSSSSAGITTVVEERPFYVSHDPNGNYLIGNAQTGNFNTGGLNYDTPAMIISNSGDHYAILHTELPASWSGAVDIAILWWQSNGGSGNVQWTISTSCLPRVGGGSMSSPTYNTGQVVTTATASAGVMVASLQTAITVTGCAATNDLLVKVERANGGGDTYANSINFTGAVLTIRHG
jgi:hypothetical protein